MDDAARRQPRPQSNWAQHGDIGALRERISGAERGIQSLSDQVGALQRDTTAQISGLSNAMAAQLASIGDKIDRQRDSATAARGARARLLQMPRARLPSRLPERARSTLPGGRLR